MTERIAELPESYAALYEQLSIEKNQTRLLYVHSVDENNNIRNCELKIANVDGKHDSYVALSYTWGSEPRDHIIECNGVKILITHSCHSALTAIARRNRLVIWVDQLCINQTNLTERSEQVSLMGQIYGKASSVYVWLGHLTLENDAARGSIDRDIASFDAAVAALQRASNRKKEIDGLAPYHNKDSVVENPFDEVLTGEDENGIADLVAEMTVFLNIFERPYFERRWIIQEVSANRNVVVLLDDQDVSLSLLFWAALKLRYFFSAADTQYYRAKMAPRLGETFIERFDPLDTWMRVTNVDMIERIRSVHLSGQDGIWQILNAVSFFRMKDPRDSVYSLRAILTTHDPPKPDYTQEATTVTLQYTVWLIQSGYGLSVFKNAPLCFLAETSSRSWCIDFSCWFDLMYEESGQRDLSYRMDRFYNFLSESETQGMQNYDEEEDYVDSKTGKTMKAAELLPDAGQPLDRSFDMYVSNATELCIPGIIVDTVSDLMASSTALDHHKFPEVWRWYSERRSLQTDAVRDRLRYQQQWAEYISYGGLNEHGAVFKEKMFYYISGSTDSAREKPPTVEAHRLRTQDGISHGVHYTTFWSEKNQHHVLTMLGYIIFGVSQDGWPVLLPPDTKIGDKLVFFSGISTPFVLHQAENLPYQHRIVGQAHILSLMWWWKEIPDALKEKKEEKFVLV